MTLQQSLYSTVPLSLSLSHRLLPSLLSQDTFNQIFVEDVITLTSHLSSQRCKGKSRRTSGKRGKYSVYKNCHHECNGGDKCTNINQSNGASCTGKYKVSTGEPSTSISVGCAGEGTSIHEIEYYGSVCSRELLRPRGNGTFETVETLTYFDNKKLRYIWNAYDEVFTKVPSLDNDIEVNYFYRQDGLPVSEQEKRRILYGNNEIEVRVQSVLQILFNEVLGPFYVFQVFSIILWAFEEYMMYASCIIIMSSLSLISSVIQIRKNQMQLRDTVVGVDNVTVCRGQEYYMDIESAKLVPGDVIVIPPHGCIMQCDAVLISGNVIVNESMLTGESVPVTKTPLPMSKSNADKYDSKEHGKHTLFCGTKVIQTRFYDGAKVKAVVLRTGFCTAKGELVRSIMFPKPVDFKFNRK